MLRVVLRVDSKLDTLTLDVGEGDEDFDSSFT